MRFDEAVLGPLLDNIDRIIQQQQKETNTMATTKHFIIASTGDSTEYDSFDNAVAQAKRYVGDQRRNRGDSYNVYEVVANVASIVPEATVTKI